MPDFFVYKYVTPKAISSKHVQGYLLNVLNKIGREAKKDFDSSTATWNEHKPKFDVIRGYHGGDAFVQITTGDDIFRFIDQGTSVRYATMTDDFSPKTAPGRIQSVQGRGGMKFVNTRYPKPGIAARNISLNIRRKYQVIFSRDIREAVHKGLLARTAPGK